MTNKFESHITIDGKSYRAVYKLPKGLGYYSEHFKGPDSSGTIDALEYHDLNQAGIVNPDDWHTIRLDLLHKKAVFKANVERRLIQLRKAAIDDKEK